MTITLNDSESKRYIEYLDEMKAIADIEEFIDVLKDIRIRLTPPAFRFDSKDNRPLMSWERGVEVIIEKIKYLNGELDKIINRHTNPILQELFRHQALHRNDDISITEAMLNAMQESNIQH